MQSFFIICPLGLEQICYSELKEKYSHYFSSDLEASSINVIREGIELDLLLHQGLLLNKILKTPTRILWRLHNQKCRDLPKLYKIIKKISWAKILTQEIVNCEVSASKSRLFHSSKIKGTFDKALKDYFNANHIPKKILDKFKESPVQTIYLRFHEDNLTISLDTTGERLHKRGSKTVFSKAPLRENIAAALGHHLLSYLTLEEKITLFDPMCGSGNLLIECLNFEKINNRNFNFEYLQIDQSSDVPKVDKYKCPYQLKELIGSDYNEKLIEQLQKIDSPVSFFVNDAFKKINTELATPLVILSNPPFGKRIKLPLPPKDFYPKLISSYLKHYPVKAIGLLLPSQHARFLDYQNALEFDYNGLKLKFIIISP